MNMQELKDAKMALQEKIDTVRLAMVVGDAIQLAMKIGVDCGDLINLRAKLERIMSADDR